MNIKELERHITKIHEYCQVNQFDFNLIHQFDKNFIITDIVALAECVDKHLDQHILTLIESIKNNVKNIQFDPNIIYKRYIETLDHLYNLPIHDEDIIILLLERIPIEIHKTYLPKIDFSKITTSDKKLFELFYDEKRKVLIHYHRIKNQTYVKIGDKKYYPIQYETFLREIENNIDPTQG